MHRYLLLAVAVCFVDLLAVSEIASFPKTEKRETAAAIFAEIQLPPIVLQCNNNPNGDSYADKFAVPDDSLKGYEDNGPTFAEIQKAPEKFANFPLRVATVQALVEIRRFPRANQEEELPYEFRSPLNDGTKKRITDVYQRLITTRQSILEEQKDTLEAVAKKRSLEKSKRWLAHFDYTYAEVRMRLANIYEYNLALGKVKLEQLPALDPMLQQVGWRLTPVEKMASPLEIRKMADQAKRSFERIAEEHSKTPWAILATMHRDQMMGLSWKASKLEE